KHAHFFKLSALRHKAAFSLRHLRTAIGYCRRLPHLGFSGRLYMTGAVYSSLLQIDEAERHLDLRPRRYVSFSCVMGLEHLLTQYFQHRGIPTYNLQHGVTAIYEKNPQDALEYTNIISDYHLSWGQYSRQELIRYGFDPAHILAAGYPRQQTVQPLQKPASRHCVVLLSRAHFNKANMDLLTILNRLPAKGEGAFHFHLKLHPSLSVPYYQKWIKENCSGGHISLYAESKTMQEVMNSGDTGFCIVVNSSAYYESYMYGRVALRYYSPEFDSEYAVADDKFTSLPELERLLQQLYNGFEKHFPAARIRKGLQYVLGLPGNEYGKILNSPE
ncbi:MAG: hypothetical protein JST39_15740, partial [Bacteroidetes bacterium]|nr:hypothetical protein [Bacteroidota bacterium]